MARSHVAGHDGATGEQPQSRRAAQRKPVTTPRAGLTYAPNSGGVELHQAARLHQALGNQAVRRVVAGSAPQSPQRAVWTVEEFSKKTYQSVFTKKSAAQKAVIDLLGVYNATPLQSAKRTQAHANLLMQMRDSAQLWIDDHTVTDEEGTSEDPARVNRMTGFKEFLALCNTELEAVKTDVGPSFTDEVAFVAEEKAFRTLRDHYKGSADSLFVKAAVLLNKAVSKPGDSASIEIEFEIPVDPTGVGFIGGRLKVEADKDDASMMKVRTEMAVTGGAKVGIAKIKAELGGYIEAQAATAADAMNLYSYGLYRRFRESDVIPSEMTNYLWGGQTSKHGKKKAEAWSRELETRLFGMMPDVDPADEKYKGLPGPVKKRKIAEDQALIDVERERVKATYVETGGIVAGKGEVGLEGIAKLSLGVKTTRGTKITAETLEKSKGGAGERNVESIIGGQKSVGEATKNTTVEAGIEALGLTGGLKLGFSGDDREIEFAVGGKIPASALGGLASYLSSIAVSGVGLYRTVKANEGKSESLAPLMAFGLFQAKLVGTPVAGVIAKQNAMGLVGDVGVKFVAKLERKDGAWGGSLELRHVSGGEKDLPIGLKVALEKSSRIAKWTYVNGEWV